MIPFVVLVTVLLGARPVGFGGVDALDGWQPAVRVGLASMLLLTVRAAHAGPTLGARAASPLRSPPALQVAFLVAATTAF